MNALILTLHISVALLTTITTVGVIVAAHMRRETKAYGIMLGSCALTMVSGVGLLFVTTGALGRFCVIMTLFSLSTLMARAYYRRQLATETL